MIQMRKNKRLQSISVDMAQRELLRRKNQAKLELSKIKFRHYLEFVHHGIYIHGRHTELIAERVDQVEQGKIKRLMIFLPPRHSKSMTISETFPSYFIGKNPEKRVILSSYGDSLARKFGRLNRDKVIEFGSKLFDISLSRSSYSTTNWNLDNSRGGMISSGIGGSITGEGADLLIIDDPIKNRKEANSITYREMVWNEWTNTLLTRLQPEGRVILIMTRWHEDDLAGRILDREKDKWEVLKIPAICEGQDDPLDRELGEALWSEYGFDEAWAEDTKTSVGSQTWISLYQQRPSPPEGSIIQRKWFNYYTELPDKFDEIIQSWDCTFKDADTSDFVVGQVWGRKGSSKYLIDEVRDRMDLPTTIQAIRQMSRRHPKSYTKLIEDKANGSAVIQMLQDEISGLIPINPDGGKIVRLQAVSPTIEAGNVYLPDPTIKSWILDFVEEVVSFPTGKHDDRVDSMSMALNRLLKDNKARIRVL